MFAGKKSFAVAVVMIAVGAAESAGWIPYGVGTALGFEGAGGPLILNGLGLAALRMGIKGLE